MEWCVPVRSVAYQKGTWERGTGATTGIPRTPRNIARHRERRTQSPPSCRLRIERAEGGDGGQLWERRPAALGLCRLGQIETGSEVYDRKRTRMEKPVIGIEANNGAAGYPPRRFVARHKSLSARLSAENGRRARRGRSRWYRHWLSPLERGSPRWSMVIRASGGVLEVSVVRRRRGCRRRFRDSPRVRRLGRMRRVTQRCQSAPRTAR